MYTLIEKRKQYREYLEVEIMKLENAEPVSNWAKCAANILRIELDRVTEEIKNLKNGIEPKIEIDFVGYIDQAADYERNKKNLRAETDPTMRLERIHSANRWTKFKQWIKSTGKDSK